MHRQAPHGPGLTRRARQQIEREGGHDQEPPHAPAVLGRRSPRRRPVLPARSRAQQSYPSRPVRFILPFGAAGVADITARLAAEKLGDKLGQRFVVENQPGPGGIAAARAVLSQPPDGYTIGLVTNGTAISAAIYKALPFDPVKEFAPISTIGAFDLVFATNADSEFKTLPDFIKAARAQPGKLNVGTIAVGGTAEPRGRAVQVLGRAQLPDRSLPRHARRHRRAAAQRHPAHGRFLRPDEADLARQEDPAARHLRPAALAVPPRRADGRASRAFRATRSRRGTECSLRSGRRRRSSSSSTSRSARSWRSPR